MDSYAIALLFFNLDARCVCVCVCVCVCSTPLPDRCTAGNDAVPIVLEANGAQVLVRSGAENLFSAGIRSPDRPARNEALYRLRYSGPQEEEEHVFVNLY